MCTASDTLSKIYDVSIGFDPPPSFEAVYWFICGRLRVAVSRHRMIFLDDMRKQVIGIRTCMGIASQPRCINIHVDERFERLHQWRDT